MIMKLGNIYWATANKGIFTKRYMLFLNVDAELQVSFVHTYMLFASWEVRTDDSENLSLTEILKIYPDATGRRQCFQVQGRSFSRHESTPLYFFYYFYCCGTFHAPIVDTLRTVTMGRDRKIRIALRINRITGFLTLPSKKKKFKERL